LVNFAERLGKVVVPGLAHPDLFVGGPVFGAAAGVARNELDEGFGEDLRGGVVSVLARFEDFVFVESSGGFVHGLFWPVVPTHIDPLFATKRQIC